VSNLSLWPKDIENCRTRAPLAILKEQASMLGELTKYLVKGEVYADDNQNSENFRYDFFIKSPPLGNYQYQLLAITHDVSLYPVKIFVEDAIQEELGSTVRWVEEEQFYEYILAGTEEEFIEALKAIFGANKTVKVITALLSQADPNWEAKGDWVQRPIKEDVEEDEIPF
jgi:hypothetical protein